jgi:hypothetical protein
LEESRRCDEIRKIEVEYTCDYRSRVINQHFIARAPLIVRQVIKIHPV